MTKRNLAWMLGCLMAPWFLLAQTSAPVITSPLTFDEGWIVTNRDDDPNYRYTIVATGSPTQFGAANLPPGATINSTTGQIVGPASIPGLYQVAISATNSA